MTDFSVRVSELIKALGIRKTAFAEKLNVSQAFVSQMCSGASRPSDRTISDICREFGVSETWLRTGEGEMFLQLSDDAEFIRVCEQINMSDDDLIKRIIKSYWGLDEKEKAAIRKLIDGFLTK